MKGGTDYYDGRTFLQSPARFIMTEPDAHRYIEKTAMDTCKPKREIAESIIKTYK